MYRRRRDLTCFFQNGFLENRNNPFVHSTHSEKACTVNPSVRQNCASHYPSRNVIAAAA